MGELGEGRFSSHYENTSKGSFLVVEMPSDTEIQELQVEQINSNSFPGILKFNVQYKNSMTYIFYNITSKIGIEQFLNRRKLTKVEFINIIQSVARTLMKSQNFLIYDNNLVIDKRYIFINSSTLEISLLYLPVDRKTDILSDYKDFVMDLITKAANIDEGCSDNYLQRILTKLKSDQFSIESFNKLLCEITLLKESNPEDIKIQQQVEIAQEKNSQKVGPVLNQNLLKYKKSSYVMAIGFQILICSLLMIVIISGTFSKIKDPGSTFAGGFLLLLGSEYFLYRKLFDKKCRISGSSKQKEVLIRHDSEKFRDIGNQFIKQENRGKAENINDTVFLGGGTFKGAMLKGLNEGKVIEIKVLKESFLIGRFKPQVDFVIESKFIGKVHSEIIYKEEGYFIKDINSQNGTFINNRKIDSNKEYKLTDGDKISFADSEFDFFDEEVSRKPAVGL